MNYKGAINQSLRNKLKLFFRARKLIIWQQEGRGNMRKKAHYLEVTHLAGAAVFS